MRKIFVVSILLLLLIINCDSLSKFISISFDFYLKLFLKELNYDHCSKNSECKSGKCALMGTDFGNGESKNIVNIHACVPSDLSRYFFYSFRF
jgi:hypothetical protein